MDPSAENASSAADRPKVQSIVDGVRLSLVKAAHLNPIAKLRGHRFAKFPGGHRDRRRRKSVAKNLLPDDPRMFDY